MHSISFGGGSAGLAAFLFVALVLPATPTAAQDGKGREPISEIDPYTKGDPKALSKAGYVSLNPSHFSGAQSTKEVRESLGGVPVIFAETEHFVLASSLDSYDLSERDEDRAKLKPALQRLKKRLPKVNLRTRVLDPWLRLHLYADLLEQTYAKFVTSFGLEEKYGPDAKPTDPVSYLGMPAKFSVLLTNKRSELGRYTKLHCRVQSETLIYDYFAEQGSMFVGISFEGSESVDPNMRYSVVYGLARNMAAGYGGMTYFGGIFWHAGLARWFARQGNEEMIVFFDPPGAVVDRRKKDAEWPRKVRARLTNNIFSSAQDLLDIRDEPLMKFEEHMMLWSRMDFLMSKQVEERRKMLELMSRKLPWLEDHDAYLGQFQARFKASLKTAYGMDLAAFDGAWAEYVLKNYPKR